MVQRVRRVFGIRSAGHTGTLDPFASGLLVVLLGSSTRLAQYLAGETKRYLATARLGFATTTDDRTGEPLPPGARDPGGISGAELDAALRGFLGTSRQRPPAFSARHIGGERSYRRARRGEAVELPESEVTIHAISLVAIAGDEVTFRVTVSAGTYVRAIARDLGERLDTGAHLTALRREAIGTLEVSEAAALDALSRDTRRLEPLELVHHLPRRELDEAEAAAVGHGRTVGSGGTHGNLVALVRAGRLIAVAEEREGRLQPKTVLEGAA